MRGIKNQKIRKNKKENKKNEDRKAYTAITHSREKLYTSLQ